MTDLPFAHAAEAPSRSRVGAPVLLSVAVGTAAVGAFAIGRLEPGTLGGEAGLVLLLRFMAAMKLAGLIAATLLARWRLARPIAPRLAFGYGAALVAMALAPGLIWSLSHIALAAGLFHVGLLAFLVVAWRDDDAVPARWTTLRSRR